MDGDPMKPGDKVILRGTVVKGGSVLLSDTHNQELFLPAFYDWQPNPGEEFECGECEACGGRWGSEGRRLYARKQPPEPPHVHQWVVSAGGCPESNDVTWGCRGCPEQRVTTALERGPEWHAERFPTATMEHVALKLAEEAGEVCAAIIALAGNEHPERAASVVDECADVFIVLSVLVGRYFPFTPLMEAVQTKLDALVALAPDTEESSATPEADQ